MGGLTARASTALDVGVTGCGVELFWIPVGAGTSRAQRASLRLWETIEAARARRPRATLFHSALKVATHEKAYVIELAPAFVASEAPPMVTGAVGLRGADRFTLFRYELRCVPGARIADEQWAAGGPVRLASDCEAAERMLELAPAVPPYVWGRRVTGTREMWTSDSVVSWLLVKAGLELAGVGPPAGGRAPGWEAGLRLAGRPPRRAR